LDGYRADYQRGKELNDDQKAAIAKYDEVMQNLEFARELSGQFKTYVADEERYKKKQAKKDQAERTKSDIARLASVLGWKDLLGSFGKSTKVRSDFVSGKNCFR
jgi:hypothetical protein